MIAASGRQSNASMHASYTFSEYFILPATCDYLVQVKAYHTSLLLHSISWLLLFATEPYKEVLY